MSDDFQIVNDVGGAMSAAQCLASSPRKFSYLGELYRNQDLSPCCPSPGTGGQDYGCLHGNLERGTGVWGDGDSQSALFPHSSSSSTCPPERSFLPKTTPKDYAIETWFGSLLAKICGRSNSLNLVHIHQCVLTNSGLEMNSHEILLITLSHSFSLAGGSEQLIFRYLIRAILFEPHRCPLGAHVHQF